MIRPSRILLFDASADGHHAEYVHHVMRGLAARGRASDATLAVPEAMLAAHPDLAAMGGCPAPLPSVQTSGSPWAVARAQWRLLETVVDAHRPDRVLLMYGDALVPALARRRHLVGAPSLWLIHFRPPVTQPGTRAREYIRDAVKRHQLGRMFRRPDVRVAYTLDPRMAVGVGAATIVTLPDPVPSPLLSSAERDEARAAGRAALGVAPGRHLMVLFGSLELRKGLSQTLDALRRIPQGHAERLSIAFVGPVHESSQRAFAEALAATQTRAQVIVRDEFVRGDHAIESLLVSADTVLLPYQRHVGSSAVLIRAAGLGQPTITQDVGLVGAWTRDHRLGRAVDTTDPEALAQAMAAALGDPAGAFDPETARRFAAGHTHDAFERTLLDGPTGLLS